MTNAPKDLQTVVVERDFAHPPERVWRALTQPEILADWLMHSDFKPELDHRFRFQAGWGEIDCQVREIEPQRRLSYSWSAFGVDTVVTFTLEPTEEGTRLRMEQSGFPADNKQAIGGAKAGWAAFYDKLHTTLDQL